MVYIGSEAKWRLYYEGGGKKILALPGAGGRLTDMFSAVMSTAARLLAARRGTEAKERQPNRRGSVRVRAPLGSLPRDYFGVFFFLYGYYLGGRVQYYSNVCWVMRVSTPPLTVATPVLKQLANSRVIIIYIIEHINIRGGGATQQLARVRQKKKKTQLHLSILIQFLMNVQPGAEILLQLELLSIAVTKINTLLQMPLQHINSLSIYLPK